MENELLTSILNNPHFKTLSGILERSGIDEEAFTADFRQLLEQLLLEHANDNEALREEGSHYILPAISVYKALQTYTPDALALFREMWLNGAEMGAEMLRKKARDKAFLEGWIPSVTPRKADTGAFLFRIDHGNETETEYHVLHCPYAQFCQEYDCSEIVTVFCDSDDVSFGHIHPRLIWGRTKTIGRGDAYCNFKYTLLPEEHTAKEEEK